jgi:hypothetical protein
MRFMQEKFEKSLHHHEKAFLFRKHSRDCATGFRANAPQKEKKNDPDIQIERDMSLNFYHAAAIFFSGETKSL